MKTDVYIHNFQSMDLIPRDVIKHHILSHLKLRDLFRLRRVNKYLSRICNSEYLDRRLEEIVWSIQFHISEVSLRDDLSLIGEGILRVGSKKPMKYKCEDCLRSRCFRIKMKGRGISSRIISSYPSCKATIDYDKGDVKEFKVYEDANVKANRMSSIIPAICDMDMCIA